MTDRCEATTEAGTRCSREPEDGSEYCWQHSANSAQCTRTKFNDIRRKKVLDALASGATNKTAAAKAAVHRDTLRQWKKTRPEFEKRCIEARANFIESQLDNIAEAAEQDWRAAMQLIERLVNSPGEAEELDNAIDGFEITIEKADGDEEAA